jgi:DHA1 family inner membrane transport protein
VAVVFAGGSIALALGLPAGAWLGELAGWRVAFLAVAALGAVVVLTVATQLPSGDAALVGAERGALPDRRRFWTLAAASAVGTAGAIAAYTYVAVFVTDVSGLADSAVGAVLLARGVVSVLAVVLIGFALDRRPMLTVIATIALQPMALLGLLAFGQSAPAAVVSIMVAGLAFSAFTAALGAVVLQVAPGRTDFAGAIVSTAVNVGITAGAFLGGVALSESGVTTVMAVGAVVGALGLAIVLTERLVPRRRTPAVA